MMNPSGRSFSSNYKENDRFNAWVKELGVEGVTSDDLKDHPVLQKVFHHLMPRLRLRKAVQPYVSHAEWAKLAAEAEANEAELRAIKEGVSDVGDGGQQKQFQNSPTEAVLRKQLSRQQKLFLLVTGSQIYRKLEDCNNGSSSISGSTSAPAELAAKLAKLMDTLTRYCSDVDAGNFESLLKTDLDFNYHYHKHVLPLLKEDKQKDKRSSLKEITGQIEATMRQIATTFEQVLAMAMTMGDEAEVEVDGKPTESPSSSPTPPKVNIAALQEKLNKWMSLYEDRPLTQ